MQLVSIWLQEPRIEARFCSGTIHGHFHVLGYQSIGFS